MFPEALAILSEKLPLKEFQFTVSLSKYVSYESCAVKNGNGRANHYMDLKEISETLKVEYTRTSRIMNNLIKKGIVGVFKTGDIKTEKVKNYYIVNPYIFINGKNPEKVVCEYFENSGWKDFIAENI